MSLSDIFINIKKWSIYVIIFICVSGGIFILGYMVRGWTTPTLTIGEGQIVERTNIIYRPININGNSGCADIIGRFNGLLADYQLFLNAVPTVYNVTPDNIFFQLHTQKYSLSYKYNDKLKWSVTPFAYARAVLSSPELLYGGGCSVEYSGITGLLLADNQPSLTLGIGYRILLPYSADY